MPVRVFRRKTYRRYRSRYPRLTNVAPNYRGRYGNTGPLSFTPGPRIFQELKHVYVDYGGAMNTSFAANAQTLAPSSHGSGADAGAFLGHNVQGKYFKMRYTIQNGGTDQARCRVIVIKDLQPPAGNMALYSAAVNYNRLVLRTADIVSDINPTYPRNFVVLHDKTHLLEVGGSGRSQAFDTTFVPLFGAVQSFTRDVALSTLSPLNWGIKIFQLSDVTGVGLTYVADYAYSEAA